MEPPNSEELDITLLDPIRTSPTGLVFYKTCKLNGDFYSVGNSVMVKHEDRLKIVYILKIYCRTKGNERLLVRWYFTNKDISQQEQRFKHEIFATSYTGKLAVADIRRIVHVILDPGAIPDTVPKDVYYAARYFDHEKQRLVKLQSQLQSKSPIPKPSPDKGGSSKTPAKEDIEEDVKITLSVPYEDNKSTYYKSCSISKLRLRAGDTVVLKERDSSTLRRVLYFFYNYNKDPMAMGQFLYHLNEVTLDAADRAVLHHQEVLASNWQSEFSVHCISMKLPLMQLNIFQPIPQHLPKSVYFLKRYYDPFKKKVYPLLEPLSRVDLSVIPEPADVVEEKIELMNSVDGITFSTCKIGDDEKFVRGDYIALQNGSAFARVLNFTYSGSTPFMEINPLYQRRRITPTERKYVRSDLLCGDEVYKKVPCMWYHQKINVVFSKDHLPSNHTEEEEVYYVDDFYDHVEKSVYFLRKPLNKLDFGSIPKPGKKISASRTKRISSSSSSSCDEKQEPIKMPCDNPSLDIALSSPSLVKSPSKPKSPSKKLTESEEKTEAETKNQLYKEFMKKENAFFKTVTTNVAVFAKQQTEKYYDSITVNDKVVARGACYFVNLLEGMQLGRVLSIVRDEEYSFRITLYRYYLEEEMFLTRREMKNIHPNEAFASEFLISALPCQIDEDVDVWYLKKKERFPPFSDIPNGRLFVKRYYHPKRRLLRSLKHDVSAIDTYPVPIPEIKGCNSECKQLNIPPKSIKSVQDIDLNFWLGKSKKASNKQDSNAFEETLNSSTIKALKDNDSSAKLNSSRTKALKDSDSSAKLNSSRTKALKDNDSSAKLNSSRTKAPLDSDKGAKPSPQKNIFDAILSKTPEKKSKDYSKICIVSDTSVDESILTVLPDNMIQFSVMDAPAKSATPQLQIVTPPETDPKTDNKIQIVNSKPAVSRSKPSPPLLPAIISSDKEAGNKTEVNITHTEDGSITIATAAPSAIDKTPQLLQDYIDHKGQTSYRQCSVKDETLTVGDTVYVRCGTDDTSFETWKLGRVLRFYKNKEIPMARIMWFYADEEMVLSRVERQSLHPNEIFASPCNDEIETTSIESKVEVVYVQKGQSIPKEPPKDVLYCKRFYDPFFHSLRGLKYRLSAEDVTILAEPDKAPKKKHPATNLEGGEERKPKRRRMRPTKKDPNFKYSSIKANRKRKRENSNKTKEKSLAKRSFCDVLINQSLEKRLISTVDPINASDSSKSSAVVDVPIILDTSTDDTPQTTVSVDVPVIIEPFSSPDKTSQTPVSTYVPVVLDANDDANTQNTVSLDTIINTAISNVVKETPDVCDMSYAEQNSISSPEKQSSGLEESNIPQEVLETQQDDKAPETDGQELVPSEASNDSIDVESDTENNKPVEPSELVASNISTTDAKTPEEIDMLVNSIFNEKIQSDIPISSEDNNIPPAK